MSLLRLRRYLWQAVVLAATTGSAGPATETLTVEHPPLGVLDHAQTSVFEGTSAYTLYGCWYTVGDYYIWYSWNDGTEQIGADPGDRESALTGLTGIEVQMAAGSHTPVAIATATATAWTAASTGITATRDGSEIVFSGAFDADAAGRGGAWASRGSGHGVLGQTDLTSTSSFGLDTTRFHQVDSSNLPTGEFCIVGFRVKRGANVTGDFRMGAYLGGAGDGVVTGATLQAEKVVPPNGANEWSEVYLAPDDVVYLDSDDSPRLWIGMQGDGANSSISAENVGTGASSGDFYVAASSQVLWITGQATGAGTAMPATATAAASSNSFAVWVQLIVQAAPYYGSGEWRSWAGATAGRNDTTMANASQLDQLMVGWVWDLPPVPSLRVYTAGTYLSAHSALQQPRIELWDNVTDLLDADGETLLHDFGQTTGASTGWNDLTPATSADVDGGGLVRITIRCDRTGGLPTLTQLAFNAGEHDEFGTPDQWGWGGGAAGALATTEAEYLASSGETVISFDPSSVAASPLAPDSTVVNPGNSGGLHALIGHAGFELTANAA